MKKAFIGILILYTLCLFGLLLINFKTDPYGKAMVGMGLALFIIWVVAGGWMQTIFIKRYSQKIVSIKSSVLSFVYLSTAFALLEEAIATLVTNSAPLFGVPLGTAHITASTNYFHVIFFHSVIVFIPMFFILGLFLKRYTISPFQSFVLFGLVGVLAEATLSGKMAFLNAPFWICVYGLMVYLPAHIFMRVQRKELSVFIYPFLIPVIAFSSAATFWVALFLDTGNHFK